MAIRWLSLIVLVICTFTVIFGNEDIPCRARDVGIDGRSVVCVCDSTYCDTITRVGPEPGQFVAYTSSLVFAEIKGPGALINTMNVKPLKKGKTGTYLDSQPTAVAYTKAVDCTVHGTQIDNVQQWAHTAQDGKRFEKSFGTIKTDGVPDPDEEEEIDPEEEDNSNAIYEFFSRVRIRLFLNTRFQVIEGFGGAVTDSAAINWRTLSDGAQTNLIKTYFGKEGIEYNMMRTPIGGSDFSTHPYTLNDEPWEDNKLSNYSLAFEDYFLKVPMIKRAQTFATDEIKIIASTWSPPVWMKTNKKITGFSRLTKEYYQLYADYHLRFLEEYDKQAEIKIWGITTTNEPINGVIPTVNFNSLGWTPSGLGRWIADNLGPTIRNSRFNATKILAGDDQRYLVPFYLLGMQREAPESIDYLDGIGMHYYGNFIPPIVLTRIHNRYPDKILIATEACEGAMPWDAEKVSIGSWKRAENYAKFILQDLNNYVAGWIDWNLCLDPTGGPNWAANYVDSPILVFKDSDEFVKQPLYYAIGHFSKFIPRGSRRIRSARRSLPKIDNVAFLKPDGNIVMVFHNSKRRRYLNVRVKINSSKYIEFTVNSKSIMTVEINPN